LQLIYCQYLMLIACLDSALELLYCADMFTLNDLKRKIEFFLSDYITPENCIELFSAAEKHGCEILGSLCKHFAQRNGIALTAVPPQLDKCIEE
jgi:hypothetical protein